MFVNEFEKIHWIATERRARLLQEAFVDQLLGRPAPATPLAQLTTVISDWVTLAKDFRPLPARRSLADV